MMKFKPTMAGAVMLTLVGCSAQPQLMDYMQTNEPIPATVPTRLTDWGILRYGEDTIIRWGGQSQLASVMATGSAIALASLSTAVLAMSPNPGINRDVITYAAAGGNWLLQMVGIIKPQERNDYRLRGQYDILMCRGEFYKGLAAKRIGVVSVRRFTPQGAIYLDCIGAAQMLVDKGINGLRPTAEDFKKLEPVPLERQGDLSPAVVDTINSEPLAPKVQATMP